MLLESLIPNLPSLVDVIILIVAILGAVILCYAVFVEKERRQDLLMTIGAGALFVYALNIENALFMIAMGGFFLASLVEFIEIYLGLHKHSPEDLKKYKNMK